MAISVNVRFFCTEITGNARNGEYVLPDHSTIGELMSRAEKENGTFAENYMADVLFIVNGKLANADTVLKDADQLKVMGFVYGG